MARRRIPLRAILPMALDRIGQWLFSRRMRPFVEGIPAILVIVVVLVIAVSAWTGPDDDVVARYKQAASSALEQNDLAAAELYLRKLHRLAPRDDETVYCRALLSERQGDQQTAAELMVRLAPDDALGYGPAHFWLAKNMVVQNSQLTEDKVRRLVHHLESAIDSNRSAEEAHVLLARLYMAQGQHDEALEHLGEVVDQQPPLRLMMARIYTQQGASSRAKSELERAAGEFQSQVESDEQDVSARLLWTESLWLQGKASEAVEVLRKGLLKTDDDRLKRALADLHIRQSDRLLKSEGQQLATRLQLLQQALHYWPNHPGALARLATFVGHSGEEADAARLALKRILAEGKATATVHLILGTNAAGQGNMESAALHLEQAYGMNPQAPTVLNNLAWVLANSSEPQLERALELCNAAVQVLPSHPEIRDTRGQILMRMERWRDALLDLEFALEKLPPRRSLHEALAEVYEHVGDTELAAVHRNRAATMQDDATTAPATSVQPKVQPLD